MERIEVHGSVAPGITAFTVNNSRRRWRKLHDSYVLCAVLEPRYGASRGALRYRRRLFEVVPGSVLMMEPGELHAMRSIEGTANMRLLQVSPDAMRSILGIEARVPWASDSPLLDHPEAFLALCLLHERLVSREEVAPIEAMGSVLATLATIAKAEPDPSGPALRREVRQVAERLRHAHLEPPSLQNLADQVGLSKFRLVQVFTEQLGLPPMQYLMEWRLHLARRALLSGSSAVQAAYEAGFYDQSHFTRLFKRACGLTPRAYRRAFLPVPTRQAQAGPGHDGLDTGEKTDSLSGRD